MFLVDLKLTIFIIDGELEIDQNPLCAETSRKLPLI